MSLMAVASVEYGVPRIRSSTLKRTPVQAVEHLAGTPPAAATPLGPSLGALIYPWLSRSMAKSEPAQQQHTSSKESIGLLLRGLIRWSATVNDSGFSTSQLTDAPALRARRYDSIRLGQPTLPPPGRGRSTRPVRSRTKVPAASAWAGPAPPK